MASVTTSLERTSVQPLPGQASHDLRTCLAYLLNFGKNGEVGSERELREARGAPGARAYVSLRSGLATAQPTNQPPNDPKPVRTHGPRHTAPPSKRTNQKTNHKTRASPTRIELVLCILHDGGHLPNARELEQVLRRHTHEREPLRSQHRQRGVEERGGRLGFEEGFFFFCEV